jgi:MerR family transcriptional regulator, light-induced transcriptional regulator
MPDDREHQLRIGELGRRVGLKPELLRAWERRYGVLQPTRTAGGLRLYSPGDERRVRLMQARIADGLSPAEAATVVLADDRPVAADQAGPPLEQEAERLRDALDRFDADEAHATLDRLLAAFVLDTVLSEVVIPYLRDLGERWAAGTATVAQEHFASSLIRGRLAGLARGWERGGGPLALLACAPGEHHDLPLLAFGLALRARGWRIAYLGADTPGESIADAARALDPALVVVSATGRARFRSAAEDLTAIARARPVAIAGGGASESLAESIGASLVTDDPVAAAERLTAERARPAA